MIHLVLKIADFLRALGIDTGPGEIRDCLAILRLHEPGPIPGETFYHIINTTMVKTYWGADFVRQLMELYLGRDLEATFDLQGRIALAPDRKKKERAATSGGQGPCPALITAIAENNFKQAYAAFKGLHLGISADLKTLEQAKQEVMKACGWLDIVHVITQMKTDGQLDSKAYADARILLDHLHTLIEAEAERQLRRHMPVTVLLEKMARKNPRTESLVDCREDLMDAVQAEVHRLGRKLATRKGRRLRQSASGEVSLGRTMRSALARTGGIPAHLVRMTRQPSRPDLWLICDVSNSVRKFIYFIMTLVYTAQKSFSRIRSFLFVDNLAESTDYFAQHHWQEVLSGLRGIKGINITGFSDYGKVFGQFADNYLDKLTPSTTVMILGDAKNNGHGDSAVHVLPKIRERAKALYWLSPYAREHWSSGDCIMDRYALQCTDAFPCANAIDLSRVLSRI